MSALPLAAAAESYVAAAYLVAFALVLLYLVILGVRVGRMERDLEELADLAERRSGSAGPSVTRSVDVEREEVGAS